MVFVDRGAVVEVDRLWTHHPPDVAQLANGDDALARMVRVDDPFDDLVVSALTGGDEHLLHAGFAPPGGVRGAALVSLDERGAAPFPGPDPDRVVLRGRPGARPAPPVSRGGHTTRQLMGRLTRMMKSPSRTLVKSTSPSSKNG